MNTNPSGARVYLTRVIIDESSTVRTRELVGLTPLTHMEIARGEYVLDIEKDGYAPIRRILSSTFDRVERTSLGPARLRREVKMVETKSGKLEIRFDADAPIQVEAKLIPVNESPSRMVVLRS